MKAITNAQYYYSFYFTYFYSRAFLGCADEETFS